MDDIIARLKDTKTTVAGSLVLLLGLIKESGYEISIPPNKVEFYAMMIAGIGLLLSGGKKHEQRT